MVHRERTWITISASAIRHNLRAFQRVVGSRVGIMPIIKANAYGHGLLEVAKILRSEKTTALGVAYGEEALQLRAVGERRRVIVLSSWQTDDVAELIRQKVELVAWDWASLNVIQTAATRYRLRPNVHIKLDTGTTRIGFLPADITRLRSTLPRYNRLRIVGLFSHFANAEEARTTNTKEQYKRFTTLDTTLGLPQGIARHIACTAAILRYPEAHFGLVRLGIGLYGLWPSNPIRAWTNAKEPGFQLRPALSWQTRIAQIKTVPRGTGIGYGATVIVRQPKRVGIVPIGYGDGYDRRLSNTSWMMVGRHRAPIIGRVCMNLTMIDLSHVPAARPGDLVTILGQGISVDDWSVTTGALNYELVTRISPTITRWLT